MEFNAKMSKAVAYKLSETDIRKNFLDWVIIGDNTPIDIACNANITSVKKLLYPIRVVEADFEADWSANSIWERTEEYTVYVTKTYSRNKLDGRVTPGRITTQQGQWEFFDKQVPQKKTRTVIDREEYTNGSVEGWYGRKVIAVTDGDENMVKWLDSISIDEQVAAEEMMSGCDIQPLVGTDDEARQQLHPEIRDKAVDMCGKEVPGTRCTDFKLTDLRAEFKISVVLLPVYEVTYEYNGTSYTAWFSGSVKDSVYCKTKPEDPDLTTKKQQLDTALENCKTQRLIKGGIAFGAIPLGIIILWAITPILGIIGIIAGIILEFRFFKEFKCAHAAVKTCENSLKLHLSNLDEKKKAIAAIVRNDALSAEEQKAQIKDILNTTGENN